LEISRRVYLHSLRLSICQVSFVDGESRFMVTPSVPLCIVRSESFRHFDDQRELIGADKFISKRIFNTSTSHHHEPPVG
jgi:hypothetical protein